MRMDFDFWLDCGILCLFVCVHIVPFICSIRKWLFERKCSLTQSLQSQRECRTTHVLLSEMPAQWRILGVHSKFCVLDLLVLEHDWHISRSTYVACKVLMMVLEVKTISRISKVSRRNWERFSHRSFKDNSCFFSITHWIWVFRESWMSYIESLGFKGVRHRVRTRVGEWYSFSSLTHTITIRAFNLS